MESMEPIDTQAQREEELLKGQLLFRRGGVRLLSNDGANIRFAVTENEKRREVIIRLEQRPLCSCDTYKQLGTCCHITAAQTHLRQSGLYEEIKKKRAVLFAPKLFDAMESALPKSGNLQMEVTLFLDNDGDEPGMRIGIRIGEDRLYVIRSIPQFLDAMEEGTAVSFGKGFTFQPEWMHFTKSEQRVLSILRGFCLARDEAGGTRHGAEARTLKLPDVFKTQVLLALGDMNFRVAVDGVMYPVQGIAQMDLPIHYTVIGSQRVVTLKADFAQGILPVLKDCGTVFYKGKLYTVPRYKKAVLPLLLKQQADGEALFSFPPADFERFFSELLPFLHLSGTVSLSEELKGRLISHPLQTKVYLDKAGSDVTAKVAFCYGDNQIDPFDPDSAKGLLLLRDPAERALLDELANAGFRVRKNLVYLTGQDLIYRFFETGLETLQQNAEVFLSKDFKRLAPRKPLLQGAMRLNGARLELNLTDDGKPIDNLLPILEALKMRKKYFRLEDGAFVDLTGLEDWQELAEAIYDSAQAEGGGVMHRGALELSACRTLYINTLLKHSQLPMETDSGVENAVSALANPGENEIADIPLLKELRPYQRRGLNWLNSLYKMRMGGILADDMGLGKTVQVISLLAAVAKEEGRMPSIIVCPSSLCYNWLYELKRFAPKLKAVVLSGSQGKRGADIALIKEKRDVDAVITSYPLIRRDIDKLSEIPFRFAILDEAQYIKNAQSVGAAAVKQLNAITRFALSGTPMENSISELWSLFDFVLPGYLDNYSAFLHRYAEGERNDELLRKIRPFLLRRLKTDVLSELPKKIETTLYAQMPTEQDLIYRAAKLRLYERVDGLLKEKGMQKGRTEVLSAITELRQICCHPTLCLPDYSGASGKMEMLMDILPAALEAGHRVLLFSQFTGMLKLLQRRFAADGIHAMYLDGETPPSKRLEMTKAFNEGEAQVFLISLKAGGTGLNLTGADMVIHYDPWWNPAAEDQATDRAYRIGQTKSVDVIRLITHDTIEEQVQKLSKKKKALFDKLITAGEEMPDKLSEDDVRALFV